MQKALTTIRDNYDNYRIIIDEEKLILESPIKIKNKNKNPYWSHGISKCKHKDLGFDLQLNIQTSSRDVKYGILLFCKPFCEQPVFRFDSAGPAHTNSKGKPLLEEVVITPHFQRYNENGHEYAYRPESLNKGNNSLEIQNDINFGLSLFCMESNSFLENGDLATILEEQQKLNLDIQPAINYNDIDFK